VIMQASRLSTVIWLAMSLYGVPVGSRNSGPLVMQVSSEEAPPAQTDQQRSDAPRPARIENRKEWDEYMLKHPAPKKGCFKSAYPSTEWKEVPCGPAPTKRY
jgi:hypothetical protein